MRMIFSLNLVLFVAIFYTPRVKAEAAWSYLELLHSTTSEKEGTRFRDNGSSACGEIPSKTDCVAFTLPKLLVGDQFVEVAFKGASVERGQLYLLQGKNGRASCVDIGVATSCLVTLKGLVLDEAAVTAFLTSTITDQSRLEQAIYLAQSFAETPVLRFWHGIR